MTDLGTFALATDTRRATGAAAWSAAVAFLVVAAAAAGTRHWLILIGGPVLAAIVFYFDRKRRLAAIPRGNVRLEDDVVVVARGDRTIARLKLGEAKFTGRALKLGAQKARIQVVVTFDDRAIIAQLAVPFASPESDEEGLMSATMILDRKASRAFDALTYGRLTEGE